MKKKKILSALALLLTIYMAPTRAQAAAPGEALVPVGEAVGIALRCDGVIVSGLAAVRTQAGAFSPAEVAGLRPGDRISAVNGRPVHSGGDFFAALGALDGAAVELRAVRHGENLSFTVFPMQNEQGAWQLGLWLRDSVHGIGTVTFWDPATGRFGALGHGVSLPQGEDLMTSSGGVITRAVVSDVTAGQRGIPGELIGRPDHDDILGVVEENTLRGIFGTADALSSRRAVPAAADSVFCLGPATILSTVDGRGARELAAEITRVARDGAPTRQLSVSITDPELLGITGGIVQGMSGSPILQNGRLIGALTHVLVSDPSKGYGITMENMLAAERHLPLAA